MFLFVVAKSKNKNFLHRYISEKCDFTHGGKRDGKRQSSRDTLSHAKRFRKLLNYNPIDPYEFPANRENLALGNNGQFPL